MTCRQGPLGACTGFVPGDLSSNSSGLFVSHARAGHTAHELALSKNASSGLFRYKKFISAVLAPPRHKSVGKRPRITPAAAISALLASPVDPMIQDMTGLEYRSGEYQVGTYMRYV